ncbi:MAG: hypothetical protein ACREF3_12900 [Acetobacteraceae bacterium]
MRSLRLAYIALQAEALRLRRFTRRNITRLILAAIALPFLLAAFGFFEAAFWSWLSRHLVPELAAVAIAGANLLVAGLFLILAARSSESRVEIEALKVRQRALEDATRQLTIATLVVPVARLVLDQLRRSKDRS